jgi:hypothetical protein
MSKIASFFPPEREPEKPKTVEEQIVEYRINYRKTLKETATVLTLPLRKAKGMFRASLVSK